MTGSLAFDGAVGNAIGFPAHRPDRQEGRHYHRCPLDHKPDGKPVPDAVIFATRLDMSPDGMQEMTTKIAPMPSTEPGVYKFKATVSMAGGWQLSLGAKVQGETGTVESKLVIKATP
jgi:hypothetical protein